MNTIRMLAFAAALLITAFLFGVITDSFTFEHPTHAAMAARGTAVPGPKSAAGRTSP
jgi:hypothetical protein